MSKKDCISEKDEERCLEDIRNKFKDFVSKVSEEICTSFEPLDLDIILTADETNKMENEGWFHPDVENMDVKKHVCSVIANRLLKE